MKKKIIKKNNLNNLQKLEILLNDKKIATVMAKCLDLILRIFTGQTKTFTNILLEIAQSKENDKETILLYLKNFFYIVYSILDKREFSMDIYIDKSLFLNEEDIYKAYRAACLLKCDWDDCWERNCWETRPAFCSMDHNHDDTKKGKKPKLKLYVSKEKKNEKRITK